MASSSKTYDKYKIDRLNDTNYRTWSPRMHMALVHEVVLHEDLWNHVDGTNPCPAPILAVGATQGSIPTNQADIIAWQKADSKAISDLIFTLGDRQVELVHRLPTSKDIWDRLKLIYEHSDLASQVFAHRHLVNYSLEDTQYVTTFLEEWQHLLDETTTTGLSFTGTQIVTMLLSSLPST